MTMITIEWLLSGCREWHSKQSLSRILQFEKYELLYKL